jgi:hypothetical protein
MPGEPLKHFGPRSVVAVREEWIERREDLAVLSVGDPTRARLAVPQRESQQVPRKSAARPVIRRWLDDQCTGRAPRRS